MSDSEPTPQRTRGLKKGSMTPAHKAALELGRKRSRAVRAYLEAIEKHAPKRGPKRTIEKVRRELAEVANEMVTADTLRRLDLVQKRISLQKEVTELEKGVDMTALEAEFVANARDYGDSKNPTISHEAWRAMGVPARVLKAAGITEATID
ncbi:MAG: hypothetical protein F2520_11960 [Actinobacteria bacterium]|uniref:Unannotated protein n=1 Tax=freshwater metagenome TaxID=449393 RepID=A0A6J7KZD4_9ZZZZ|nr:hypothetical protein [Actinomycetota bacterium]MTA78964.1 hypothetical protein [Actinomycetota bacterium]